MSSLKYRLKNKFEGVRGKSKSTDGDIYIGLEKDCENIRKSGITIKKCLHKYIESKQSLKDRFLNEQKSVKQDTIEFQLANKIGTVTTTLNLSGPTSQHVEVVKNTFNELSNTRFELVNYFNDTSKTLFDNQFEKSHVEIKKTLRVVDTARANAYAMRNNKKATEEMLTKSAFHYNMEKIKRQNLMLDYAANENVDRTQILIDLYGQIHQYHLECANIFDKQLVALKKIKLEAENEGTKPHYELPEGATDISMNSCKISFSEDECSTGKSFSRGGSSFYISPEKKKNNSITKSPSLDLPNNRTNDTNEPSSEMILEEVHSIDQLDQEATAIVKNITLNSSNTNPFMPNLKTYAIVHFDFVAECNDELSVKEGDEIVVVRHVDSEWIVAEFKGSTGFVPTNYIQIKK